MHPLNYSSTAFEIYLWISLRNLPYKAGVLLILISDIYLLDGVIIQHTTTGSKETPRIQVAAECGWCRVT